MDEPSRIFYETRTLLAACVFDFMKHLASRPNPLVLGREYPDDQLISEFKIWAASRNFNISELDFHSWENLWQSEMLQ